MQLLLTRPAYLSLVQFLIPSNLQYAFGLKILPKKAFSSGPRLVNTLLPSSGKNFLVETIFQHQNIFASIGQKEQKCTSPIAQLRRWQDGIRESSQIGKRPQAVSVYVTARNCLTLIFSFLHFMTYQNSFLLQTV